MGDLSENFNRSEFECSCGCGFDTVDYRLLEGLEVIREHFGPVRVTSGCRCDTYNASIGGAMASQHKKGRAADIQIDAADPALVADFAENLGFSVGRYNTFTHVDSRTGPPVTWDNSN